MGVLIKQIIMLEFSLLGSCFPGQVSKSEYFILAICQLGAACGTLKFLDEGCWKRKKLYGKDGVMLNFSREGC